jgi:hypothetical protein
MHLPCLNFPDLFLSLWRGTLDCIRPDNVANWDWAVFKDIELWQEHGAYVAEATPFLPGSFDRPPRDPSQKLNSGYKAWEFLLYFYAIGPAVFFDFLPDKYWRHYCKAVAAFRIVLQEEITLEELHRAEKLYTEFSDEFEELYVQRREDRIHFVRFSIHSPSHLPSETIRIGPGIIYAQWTMERTIGNLGEEIRQHANMFANLAQRALRRCQVNAIKVMIPDLDPSVKIATKNAYDLGDGYHLCPKTDNTSRLVEAFEVAPIKEYLIRETGSAAAIWETTGEPVVRWGRLALPNGQIARSCWGEGRIVRRNIRSARNVKVRFISVCHTYSINPSDTPTQ